MIIFSDFKKLQELADGAPKVSDDEVFALNDKVKSGDDEALWQLFYVLLPHFCAEYKNQAGVSVKNSEQLEECVNKYFGFLAEFDFRENSDDFKASLAEFIRKARTEYVTSRIKDMRIPVSEIKKMNEE